MRDKTPFGQQIEIHRKEKGLSQRELCERLSFGSSFFSAMVCGRKSVSNGLVEKIAKALSLNDSQLSELCRLNQKARQSRMIWLPHSSDAVVEMVELIRFNIRYIDDKTANRIIKILKDKGCEL